jgi:hypothetical protein
MIRPDSGIRRANAFIWILLALFVVLGFLHLGADFPNHSRWMDDPAKFTDEGWWASGAFDHILTGHWLRAGDYNPMVANPFWSVALEVLFHFTGISIIVARGAAFLFTIGTILAGGRLMACDHPRFAPLFMLLLACSPVLYFFSHLAILEPAQIFFLTCAALAAYPSPRPGVLRGVVCGLCFTLAMLTKSSALFVFPAILFLLWFPYQKLFAPGDPVNSSDRRRALVAVTVPALTILLCYGLYWLLVLRTHRPDVNVFYAEAAPSINLRSIEKSVRVIYRCFTWVDPILFLVALVAAFSGFFPRIARSLRPSPAKDPLFGFASFAFMGYCVFMVWHVDAGPRYFLVLVMPVMILVVLLLVSLEQTHPVGFNALAAVVAIATLVNMTYIVRRTMHPDYTLRNAGLAIRSQLLSDSASASLAIGHGAAEMTYFTHLPALDDLGSMPVATKLALYQPHWFITYEDNCNLMIQPGVASAYTFRQVAAYPVFDVPGRSTLLLYRIEKNRAYAAAVKSPIPPTPSEARPRSVTVPCSTP